MAFDYGYGKLNNKLIELFDTRMPDFQAAEELIKQGADVNAIGKEEDENILSCILWNFGQLANEDEADDACDCATSSRPLGETMCDVIRFFLNHGFDLDRRDGRFGAQCLWELTLSICDRYMIEATKILLDAGAKNRTITDDLDEETPWDFIGCEGSFQDVCECNHHLANIYEATYQIYKAIEDGKPYGGIDSYEIAIGKKILKVLAKSDKQPVFYPINLPQFSKDNCYTATLYFVYDGGVLISTEYADFWTDTALPDEPLIDVSQHFEGVVGSKIRRFEYDSKKIIEDIKTFVQPITTITMSSGKKVRFSINFGEVNEEDRSAYYEIQAPKSVDWRFGVVGNIKKSHLGADGNVYYGTKAFGGVAKVYLCGKGWSSEKNEIGVIGLNRYGRIALEWVPINLIENVRTQRIYNPRILEIIDVEESMEGWDCWKRNASDRKDTQRFVKEWLSMK